MELGGTFGRYRGVLVEANAHVDGHRVLLRTSEAAVAAELGFVQQDSDGKFSRWVDASEVTDCYREIWWGDLDGHTVELLRDDAEHYSIHTWTPGLAERWNLYMPDNVTGLGRVPKAAVMNVRSERAPCRR